ncbi:MAG: hypothetical protein QG655_1952 [Actinomycetota bacterium]|nr:hypothetical protein [Actinomycetota bacterium]
MLEPIDLDRRLADPKTYETVILGIFVKRRQRGLAFAEAARGVTYFDTAAKRRALSRAIARSVAAGDYRPQPVDLWTLETRGKQRDAHMSGFTDQVLGSALYQVISHNARCYGLPGVYSYLPGLTNVTAMRAFGDFVRQHRSQTAPNCPPLYVLQSDFDHYGDDLPLGPDAPLWPILREVVSLGSPGGNISSATWELITALARPTVRDSDGTEFTRRHGVAMGTPLVPVLSNLAVTPMDRAILQTEGIFYARYNDDFVLAHPDLTVLRDTDHRLDSVIGGLGVRRKLGKEVRTVLSGRGLPCPRDPAYRGGNRIDFLGLSLSHTGAIAVGPHRQRRFVSRVARRIDAAAVSLPSMPIADRARHLVAGVNVMLDVSSPFAVPGLSALLDTTTDRGVLKDLDARIARKVVQAATGRAGVRGFRLLPPAVLYGEIGLVSLVRLRNAR